MRPALVLALLALAPQFLVVPAQAQPRPKEPPRPAKEAPPAPQPDPTAAALFPCRSPAETCYVGVVKDGKVMVLFTNDPKAETIAGKPLAVAGEGIDLAKTENRTVMLVGAYDPKEGLTRAEVVDVASPLVAFAIKSAIGGGEPDEDTPEPPAPAPRRK
ncbi:hypothetical protein VQ02_02630 [Methylobacterium variabile]|jgi:hypothetical protein|uniref:Uncharacterized protein n=1 Tax=Methylobacterium variabile TaxID=298794 RepID=A0A0J6VTK9_9HYPH|nr:hypothetical protein [Methylobacterium variabile]KMO42586.1 hypothetical protein VQ02_02630 [Methylobacterium variabile]